MPKLQDDVERRLAAIVYADVAGYSRLTGRDEVGTHKTLSGFLDSMSDCIGSHGGRVVHYAGDAVLAEFPSVLGAVECAVTVQRDLAERNHGVAEDAMVQFRFGINLGEVIVDRDDIYGDGVNVAARLEALADPGGICISEKVFHEVRNRLDLNFEDLGAQEVKNIAEPVHSYRVLLETADAAATVSPSETQPSAKASIAVLPFNNMSGDAEQEYFCDGISEDIITELSRYHSLFVIARNSSFTYKGRAVNISQVGEELGVRYVLEGSMRKAGNRVRITAQLIEAASGSHVWADRYDRELEDIFAVQDDITQVIVATLPGRLEAADLEHAKRKTPENMVAYDYLLRAKDHHHRITKDDNRQAVALFEKVIEFDPAFGQAHAWRACALGQSWVRGFCEDPDSIWEEASASLEKARQLDEDDCECQRLLGGSHLIRREFEKAELHQRRALELNPNDPRIVSQMGEVLTFMGQTDEGLEWLEKALRLDPHSQDRRYNNLGIGQFAAQLYADAVASFRKVSALGEQHHAYLAAASARTGDQAAAGRHTAEVIELNPDFSASAHVAKLPYMHDSDRRRHREAL
ncbi:MAG: adenylate/guanylate cyclase domain-containing protein, partial [Alphaproteobacteria bacterium]|nr:adenylate/guanylate cyclase domain-containing protein [Alphaproteobacteria bacterium]